MPDLSQLNQLQTALQAMLPSGVCAVADRIAAEAESFDYREEGQHLTGAVVGRRNEFIAGRRCARAALRQVDYLPCALPADRDGLPMWPVGAIGSISHSRGLCCAVAASVAVVRCLGIDLEKTNRLSARAMARVLHPREECVVGEDQALGSLLFSVKEAFFKAQFPIWGAQPNFKDLALQIDRDSQQMSTVEIAPHLPEGLRDAARLMQFRYQFIDDYVVTLCWLNGA